MTAFPVKDVNRATWKPEDVAKGVATDPSNLI